MLHITEKVYQAAVDQRRILSSPTFVLAFFDFNLQHDFKNINFLSTPRISAILSLIRNVKIKLDRKYVECCGVFIRIHG